ncbi:hypothetical protein AALO_G00118220 [Alosa alosa]|uniref:Uncharacterized protein n=1 Tax=Alosa alosa TaxID=278164 RepID=A0AAV6GQS8_9TELE|nr:hypothetical protein AALO_G00118220 [Alosa alosa]
MRGHLLEADGHHGRPIDRLLHCMEEIWSIQRRYLDCIQDPEGVELYTQTGEVTKGGVMLPVFRCTCWRAWCGGTRTVAERQSREDYEQCCVATVPNCSTASTSWPRSSRGSRWLNPTHSPGSTQAQPEEQGDDKGPSQCRRDTAIGGQDASGRVPINRWGAAMRDYKQIQDNVKISGDQVVPSGSQSMEELGNTVVGFGAYSHHTFRSLYNVQDEESRICLDWVRQLTVMAESRIGRLRS